MTFIGSKYIEFLSGFTAQTMLLLERTRRSLSTSVNVLECRSSSGRPKLTYTSKWCTTVRPYVYFPPLNAHFELLDRTPALVPAAVEDDPPVEVPADTQNPVNNTPPVSPTPASTTPPLHATEADTALLDQVSHPQTYHG